MSEWLKNCDWLTPTLVVLPSAGGRNAFALHLLHQAKVKLCAGVAIVGHSSGSDLDQRYTAGTNDHIRPESDLDWDTNRCRGFSFFASFFKFSRALPQAIWRMQRERGLRHSNLHDRINLMGKLAHLFDWGGPNNFTR